MSENLTDVDEFTATIAMPVGGELAVASQLRDLAIQRLANRTHNNKSRLDDHDTEIAAIIAARHGAMYTFSGTSIAVNTKLALTENVDSNSSYTLSSDTAVVPEAGYYLANLAGEATCSDTNTGVSFGASLRKNAVIQGSALAYRFSTDTGDRVLFSVCKLIHIATPASEALSVYSQTSAGTVSYGVGNAVCNLVIVRIA